MGTFRIDVDIENRVQRGVRREQRNVLDSRTVDGDLWTTEGRAAQYDSVKPGDVSMSHHTHHI